MALMVHKSSLPTFEFSPNAEFDADITAIKNRYESIMEKIKTKKVSAADVYYAGASITDEATQTEESEIVDVKNATKVLMGLSGDSKSLKSKLEVFYESTMTEYQNLVESKANLIYDQCAELLRDIQRQNDATLERTRRAYKQQLADAISSLSTMYTKNMQLKLRTVELRQTDMSEKNAAENLRLRERIRTLEDQIQSMTRELGDIERAKALEWNEGDDEMVSVGVSPFKDSEGQAAKEAVSLTAKLDMQEAEIADLKAKILDCEMIIKSRDLQIDKLEQDIKEVGADHASQAAEVTRLQGEKARLENELLQQGEHLKAQLKEKLAAMEMDLQNSIENAREEVRAQAKQEMRGMLEDERAKYLALAEEKRRVEHELAKERKAILERSKDDRDIEAMRAAKIRAETEADRLRKDIEKIHRMWEKKFNILQSSLHALKDEMFVRRYLEKQAAQLHTSAVAFVFGKHAMSQEIPKMADQTVRSKTIMGMNGVDDMKQNSSLASSTPFDRGAQSQSQMEGVGVPFRQPNKYVRRTVWDTRPPTQSSVHNPTSQLNEKVVPGQNDDQSDHENITNKT